MQPTHSSQSFRSSSQKSPKPCSEAAIAESSSADSLIESEDVELGYRYDDEDGGSRNPLLKHPEVVVGTEEYISPSTITYTSQWSRQSRKASLLQHICSRRTRSGGRTFEMHNICSRPKTCRARILRCLAVVLILLGVVELVTIITGLVTAFFPDKIDRIFGSWSDDRPSNPLSHWPTDYTADIAPVACHSHNDYWRKVPLKSAIQAGCTSVEADVWLYGDELYVGHTRSSLTSARTLRSLYVDPLLEILNKQNPQSAFHPSLDKPRNGVFDTNPNQSLVLLIDFKTDGAELWPFVSAQLEPLRRKKYLSHFNGTAVTNGPITVVVTGNAPFTKVIENSNYRDMFFDAPLAAMAALAPTTTGPSTGAIDRPTPASPYTFELMEERTYLASIATSNETDPNQGQGYSGAAPTNPAIYSPANSYYASAPLIKTIGIPLPFVGFRAAQQAKLARQIAGAHAQGLNVRYWDTPAWPIGLRNYVWRTLVTMGADYLNVDDLQAATRGAWSRERWFGW